MSGDSGRRSIVVGLLFLAFAVGVMIWTYTGHWHPSRIRLSGENQQELTLPGITRTQPPQNPLPVLEQENQSGVALPAVLASRRGSQSVEKVSARPVAYAQSSASRLAVPPDANPEVASVVEAAKTGSHPERRTVFIAPKPFDRVLYDADPDAYCRVIEPGRVWLAAKPAKGVPALEVIGDSTVRVPARGTVELAVQAVADAPVAFSSMDLGAFENRLTSITVRTDGKGIGRARFTATEGTTGAVNILAACPLTTGQVHFYVEVQE